jgi:hypothetical protein
MREIVEREPKDGGDGENFDDIGAACHWYNSNPREADIVGDLLGTTATATILKSFMFSSLGRRPWSQSKLALRAQL